MANGRTISNADRAQARALTRMQQLRRKQMTQDKIDRSEGRNISDAARARLEELLDYMEKNDGGSTKSPRDTIVI